MNIKFLKATLVGFVLSVSCVMNIANAGLISSDDYDLTEIGGLWTYGYTNWNAMSQYGNFGNVSSERDKIESLLSDGYSDYYGRDLNFNGTYAWNASDSSTNYFLTFQFDQVFQFESVDIITSRLFNQFSVEFFNNGIWNTADYSNLSTGGKANGVTESLIFAPVISDMMRIRVGRNTSLHEVAVYGSATTVPEPSTLAIFALGMIGLASRRFKNQS